VRYLESLGEAGPLIDINADRLEARRQHGLDFRGDQNLLLKRGRFRTPRCGEYGEDGLAARGGCGLGRSKILVPRHARPCGKREE
jgi:hypothetical protein